MKLRRLVAGSLAGLALLGGTARGEGPLDRGRDPVVATGGTLPTLLGARPIRIVGFRWSGSWEQVPVQVDEMAVVDFGTIYGSDPVGQTILTYTDEGTFTGPDPDPGFDADDELVFMARHTGPKWAGGSPPPHTLAGSGVELVVTDPLDGVRSFLYLFLSDGSLDPAAGRQLVNYRFVLLSGDYKSTYKTSAGPNPEDSRVTSPAYEVHFADRWIRDETAVREGGATGEDLLDRHKNLFGPGECGRSEDTFSDGEGAFIVNRSGPVRALRGYVGANSGVTTHRIHLFYEAREDILSRLRVHAIGGVMDYFDYAPAASGMTYRNDLNPDGVPVDGVQDTVAPGEVAWEMVTGDQGTLAISHLVTTDIPDFDYTWYYSDRAEPEITQCTGDAFEYGASGLWRDGPIPNTDPSRDPHYVLETTRVIKYAGPNRTLDFALRSDLEARHPLSVVAGPLPSGACPDADGDGYASCDASCTAPEPTPCGDCNDANDAVHPGQTELCNGLDDDCEPATEDGSGETWHGQPCDGPDADLCPEGTYACSGATKACTDHTADTPELCGNGLDDDCDGLADAADPDCTPPACPDADGDGYASCDASCTAPEPTPCGDCNDANDAVHPGQTELCNGLDDDCEPATEDGSGETWHGQPCDGPDADLCPEGTYACSGATKACTDHTADTPELCGNGLDDDCDGLADEAPDQDSDSVSDCLDDCPGTSNPDQADFDQDGIGDACEAGSDLADANRSGRVDGFDLARLARAFGSACGEPRYDPTVDLTRDCLVDGDDLALLAAEFGRSVPP